MKKVLAIAWTAGIIALCTIPGDNLPDVDVFSADKIGHFILFTGFGWLWTWVSARSFRQAVPIVLFAGLLFAVGTEIYQGILPFGREPSTADVIANLAGLLFGVWLFGRLLGTRSDPKRRRSARPS